MAAIKQKITPTSISQTIDGSGTSTASMQHRVTYRRGPAQYPSSGAHAAITGPHMTIAGTQPVPEEKKE